MSFERILIANNGLAAAKFLISMRKARGCTESATRTSFVGMVTKEDLKSNSTYIQLLDYVIPVQSGPSRENFGNVDLIVATAQKHNCDAVWPGWGHASENYLLAQALEKVGITWIGPSSDSMVHLGDKVESLLQAQAVGVPCVAWSGESASNASECGLYSDDQVVAVCDRIGYPVMLKASNGGGGRGIRRVNAREECLTHFHQIRAEVKDGIIFAMKCVDDCRHVEIQIIGDGKGSALALSGRDCSVQRRHQKLVEEGPPPFIPSPIFDRMKKCAESLCSSVNYKSAGTVEYLYHPQSDNFYFLEVNCRLQVEHPVTEMLMQINIPYCQVLIAQGTPLAELPGIQAALQTTTSSSHVIACRIVAEDPLNKWLPSSGDVYEIRLPCNPPKQSFAYFGASKIHQYSDSQFGHVFVSAPTRMAAIQAMREYLSDLTITGSVSTNIQFMLSQIFHSQSDFATKGPPSTNWLDSNFSNKSPNTLTRLMSSTLVSSPISTTKNFSASIALLAVSAHLAMSSFWNSEKEILRWVRKGHRAPHVPSNYSEKLLCPGGEKVSFLASRTGPKSVLVDFSGMQFHIEWTVSGEGNCSFTRAIMQLSHFNNDGALMVSLVNVTPTKIRVQVARDTFWHQFEIEEDKTKIYAPMNGRLVRWLVPDKSVVVPQQRVCEIEAMKMITVVTAKAAGCIAYKIQEGVSFIEGDILANLEEVVSGGSLAAPVLASQRSNPATPLGVPVLSVVGGLMNLQPSENSSPNEEDELEGAIVLMMDGFPSTLTITKAQIALLSPTSIDQILSKFVQDEVRALRLVHDTVVGDTEFDMAAMLASLSEVSDSDLVAAWRHRATLRERAAVARDLIMSSAFRNTDIISNLIQSLDKVIHRDLISVLSEKLRKLSPLKATSILANFSSTNDLYDYRASIVPNSPSISKRRQMAVDAGSFFIYDLPAMLEESVKNLWISSLDFLNGSALVECTRLVLSDSKNSLLHEPFKKNISESHMNCGMVAWLVKMKTPESKNFASSSRQAVFIGNDISYQIGTFSLDEDKLYLLASEYARSLGIPRIYIACNSGARLGLCADIQNAFKVKWKNPNHPEDGFEYLYLDMSDYDRFANMVVGEKIDDKNHFRITDILGKEGEYIGVENLVWSGAIAGESSRAYNEIFTLTYVTGRTVGIGAYISRLCQRIIQKTDSPILLTGYQALNKLIGSNVYRSNDEIGGVGVMFRNGVSHLTVRTDIEGVSAILNWLQYVPERAGAALPIYQSIQDPIDRPVTLSTTTGDTNNSRNLVEGDSTIFDRGSFVEVQSGWARSVIVGRAKIGGIPIGVIVVETRQTHYYQPADPADPHSQSVARPQAGQVWYPDSAYKTAQAIMDFDREELPLMVLANWRGFSGGQRDMFNEILKFGSYIVDALVVYSRPIFVYLPPKSELRGGAWVVIDSRINPDKIEMYADPTARGGVLEPSGTTEIKFRNQALFDLMMRTDTHAKLLQADTSLDDNEKKAQLNERFNNIKPTLIQIANSFADMHDTPKRMQHVGAIRGIVEWEKSRAFFHRRLKDRLGLK